VAALGGKLDEVADPKVQIEQAIEEAKTQHQLLTQQAAAVIGNERELQLKLTRQIEETEKLQANARQALLLAEQARKQGDEAKAGTYEDSARAFATKLVTSEAAMADLHAMHERAAQASKQARAAVETNALNLQKKLAERTRLLSQLDQAKMQERLNEAMANLSGLAPAGATPSLDEVRDKIEARYARALGQAELTSNSVEARMLEVEKASMDVEGAARLESIRESLGLAPSAAAGAPALEPRHPRASGRPSPAPPSRRPTSRPPTRARDERPGEPVTEGGVSATVVVCTVAYGAVQPSTWSSWPGRRVRSALPVRSSRTCPPTSPRPWSCCTTALRATPTSCPTCSRAGPRCPSSRSWTASDRGPGSSTCRRLTASSRSTRTGGSRSRR
jgi:phage shock protein A